MFPLMDMSSFCVIMMFEFVDYFVCFSRMGWNILIREIICKLKYKKLTLIITVEKIL